MRRKEQRSMLMLAIIMAFVVGVFWAGPVGAGGGNPCAALQMAAERLGCPGAPVEETGQTECYDADGISIICAETGQDGDLQKGVAWPEPRFTDNEDGTVTDNLTGLMWLKEANHIGENCPGFDNDGTADDGAVTWEHALNFVGDMNAGTYSNCGHTDWRLPNVKELQSLIHYGVYDPAVPNTAGTDKWSEGDPFSGVESHDDYWSSTTIASYTGGAWYVFLFYGNVGFDYKGRNCYIWPVRGGE